MMPLGVAHLICDLLSNNCIIIIVKKINYKAAVLVWI